MSNQPQTHLNPSQISRRDFLQRSVITAGMAGTAGLVLPRTIQAKNCCCADSGIKLSLAAYSMRRYLPFNWPKPRPSKPTMNIADFVDYCGELELEGTELTSYFFPKKFSTYYLASLKLRAMNLGMNISGSAIGNNFCLPEGEARQADLKMCRQWVDYSAIMGAPVIRIFAGYVPKGDTEAAAIERCISGINESVEYAASKGVALALENHGGVTAQSETMLKIIKAVDESPYFGVNLDTGNFRVPNPYKHLEAIAPYAINVQLKTEMHPQGKGKGQKAEPADLERLVKMIRDVNYNRYLVLEYEATEDPRVAIPRYLQELRSLLA